MRGGRDQVYKTVKGRSEAVYEINKSRFLTFVSRVESEAEAAAFVQQIRKQHWDATHNCAAYVLGPGGRLQKADDDGEPSGTAGRPMLEVLKKNDLTDVAAVVTRYFGGVKLGAGGLIRAYGKAVSLGLAAACIVEMKPFCRIAVEVEYALFGTLENQLRERNLRVAEKSFTDRVRFVLLAPQGEEEAAVASVADWTAGRARFETLGETLLELPIEAAVLE